MGLNGRRSGHRYHILEFMIRWWGMWVLFGSFFIFSNLHRSYVHNKTRTLASTKLWCNLWGHSRLGYYFWASNGLRTILDNFTYLVCLDLYCGAYFGSYLHFILHVEYTDKVNLQGIGSSKISFWFLKGHSWVLSKLFTLGSRNEKDNKN
jgi:hypothetical protein